MQTILLDNTTVNTTVNTGSLDASSVNNSGGYVGNSRTFFASVSNTGAVDVTVTFYQVLAKRMKRLVATINLTQASPSAAIDLVNPGQSYLAEAVFAANPSGDTVFAGVEG